MQNDLVVETFAWFSVGFLAKRKNQNLYSKSGLKSLYSIFWDVNVAFKV